MSLTPVTPGTLTLTPVEAPQAHYFDVLRDYGATGNGKTDDSGAIQAAINDAGAAGGGIVFLGPKTFLIANMLDFTGKSQVSLMGTNRYASTIKIADNTDINAIGTATSASCYSANFSDFQIDCNRANNASATNNCGFEGWFDKCSWFRVFVPASGKYGLHLGTAGAGFLNRVMFSAFAGETFGVFYDQGVTDSWILFNDIYATKSGGSCLAVSGSGPFRIIGNHLDASTVGDHCFYHGRYAINVIFAHNLCEDARLESMYFARPGDYGDGGESWQITSNYFTKGSQAGVGAYPHIRFVGGAAPHRAGDLTIADNLFEGDGRVLSCVDLQFAFNATIGGNNWQRATSGGPPVTLSNCTSIRIAGNTDDSFSGTGVQQQRGTGASVSAATSSLAVSHSLGQAPGNVRVTPTSDTQGRRWWISAKGASTFTISLDANATTNPITFDWEAYV